MYVNCVFNNLGISISISRLHHTPWIVCGVPFEYDRVCAIMTLGMVSVPVDIVKPKRFIRVRHASYLVCW